MRFCDSLGLVFLKQENPPAALTRLKFENLNLQISFNRKYRRFCAHCRATRLQIKKRILIANLVSAGLVQIAAGCAAGCKHLSSRPPDLSLKIAMSGQSDFCKNSKLHTFSIRFLGRLDFPRSRSTLVMGSCSFSSSNCSRRRASGLRRSTVSGRRSGSL